MRLVVLKVVVDQHYFTLRYISPFPGNQKHNLGISRKYYLYGQYSGKHLASVFLNVTFTVLQVTLKQTVIYDKLI